MTGWRFGYGVMEEKLAGYVARLATNCNSCTASFTQMAAAVALTGPQDDTAKMVAEFHKRRDVIVDGLNAIDGITCRKPLGAFYVFPNIKASGKSSKEMEVLLLEKYGVAALAGTSFGKYGEGYLRFSYANSVENIQKAIKNVSAAFSDLMK